MNNKYNDDEFMDQVKDKKGNVRFFKKCLKEHGLIGNRQQFSDDHVALFLKARDYKNNKYTTWDEAFSIILGNENNDISIDNIQISKQENKTNVESLLSEILETLQRIEKKL